jgi:hypothetical protein
MTEFQEHYGRSCVSKSVYSIPCVDQVLNLVCLNLVCQDILKKLGASMDESEVREIATETVGYASQLSGDSPKRLGIVHHYGV